MLMLSKKENLVMNYIYSKCENKESVLISPNDIVVACMDKYELNNIEIEQILNGLALDNYIDVINSDKKGKLVYCITLKQKGVSFKRDREQKRKTTAMLITRTVLLAILSFVVGVILKAIFF